MKSDDISLAQWSLIDEYRTGRLRTLDFPRTARQDFGLNGIELVNTLLEVPTEAYLKQLKMNADYHGVIIVLLMVDDEGDGCSATKEGRKEFVTFHRKWVDIAQYLGCHAIRTNCRGHQGVDGADALDWAAESYHYLLDYAKPAGIKVLIENHGGVSNDADWMVRLMKTVGDPFLGAYPDWRQPGPEFDNFAYLQKVLPYAQGMSYRNQPTDELTNQMLGLCRQNGFHGWYGIESVGRDQIRKGIRLLRAYHQENAAVS
ncbi:MAG TPA: sugar phosphate isomerase/epimerase family protein [Puia sp.]|nr:sugar phosphate isomerase/epimerase family protein [Puia sp.]